MAEDETQIEGLPAGATVRPIGQQIEGLPAGAVLRPVGSDPLAAQNDTIRAMGGDEKVPGLFSGGYQGPTGSVAPGESLPHAVTRQAIGGIGRGIRNMVTAPYEAIKGTAGEFNAPPGETGLQKAYRLTGLAMAPAFGGVSPNVLSRGAVGMVRGLHEGAKQGDIGAATEAATYAVAPEIGGRVLGKLGDIHAARAEAAIPAHEAAAIKTIKEGLKGGRGVEENIDRAVPYLKEVGRSNPKTVSDVHAGIDAQRAKIGTAIQEQAVRHPEVRVSGDDVAGAVAKEITPETRKFFPEAVKQIEGEVNRFAGKDLTAPEALETAATLRAMKKSYFNAAPSDQAGAERASGSVRAIDAAHDTIVDKLAERLEATGENGVKDMRADYGALRNLTDAAYKAKVREGQTPKPTLGGSIIDTTLGHRGVWSIPAAIAELAYGHPLAAAATMAAPPVIGAARYLREAGRTPTAILTRGMGKLGRLPGELPDYSPNTPNIKGLLGKGSLVTPMPADTSTVRGEPSPPTMKEAQELHPILTDRYNEEPTTAEPWQTVKRPKTRGKK